ANLASPRLGDFLSSCDVIDHQDQLVIVIAVENLDVDARVGHSSGELAELTGDVLLQPLHQHLALGKDLDAGGLERLARGRTVMEREFAGPVPPTTHRPTPSDPHPAPPQSPPLSPHPAGPIPKSDRKVTNAI